MITTLAKTDSRLRPGIFLDYYIPSDGKFSGQYIVCDIQDFVGKRLHHRIGAEHFKLHLHRTEVVRDPYGAIHPAFPTRKKYWRANFTIEGLEDAQVACADEGMDVESYVQVEPKLTEAEEQKSSELIDDTVPPFKYSATGKKLPVDASGTWIRRTANWRPGQIEAKDWKVMDEEIRNFWRR